MKVFIVDDERLVRLKLRRLLKDSPEVEIIGEARNADEAFGRIEQLQPELVFLDVKMPGGDGFQLREHLDTLPIVIFTTAYNQSALTEVNVPRQSTP